MVLSAAACGSSSGKDEKESYNLKFSLAVSENNFQAESWRTWADAVTKATDDLSLIHIWIQAVKFYGDFFGNGELEELERNLRGAALDENLESRLEELHLNDYMNGVTRCV